MTENNDILKANNLRQMVAEYEQEQQVLQENRKKNMQRRHDNMKEAALQKLEELRERELARLEDPLIQDDYYHFHSLITGYTDHVYYNALANLKRKYAMIFDAKNLDKYPVPTPLPRMQDLMDPYMPSWMTYEGLKALAAYCPRWRQK